MKPGVARRCGRRLPALAFRRARANRPAPPKFRARKKITLALDRARPCTSRSSKRPAIAPTSLGFDAARPPAASTGRYREQTTAMPRKLAAARAIDAYLVYYYSDKDDAMMSHGRRRLPAAPTPAWAEDGRPNWPNISKKQKRLERLKPVLSAFSNGGILATGGFDAQS